MRQSSTNASGNPFRPISSSGKAPWASPVKIGIHILCERIGFVSGLVRIENPATADSQSAVLGSSENTNDVEGLVSSVKTTADTSKQTAIIASAFCSVSLPFNSWVYNCRAIWLWFVEAARISCHLAAKYADDSPRLQTRRSSKATIPARAIRHWSASSVGSYVYR